MISELTSTTNDFLFKGAWTTVIGNSIEYEYYTGVEIGNPSGSTDNIQKEIYKDGNGDTQFVVNYTYNSDDNVISETCTKS